MKIRFQILVFALLSVFNTCKGILRLAIFGGLFTLSMAQEAVSQNKPNIEKDELFKGFVTPPAQARPFVRWWWNGNRITSGEIKRELDILAAAGIGGIEINPIAMPEEAADTGTKPVEWLSKDWNRLLALAAREAKQWGMITDLLVGSGWPFGGEFLKEDETIQRVITHKIRYPAGTTVTASGESLYQKAMAAQSRQQEPAKSYEVFFVKLVPVSASGTSGILDLTDRFKADNQLVCQMPSGDYELVYGILQHGHRQVMHGAPGAAGPVMDHYDKTTTVAYLNRLKKISEDTGIPLHELLRALFCDSIELAGSNWTDGFGDIFHQTYHYKLEPYFPFVFYDPYNGYPEENYSPGFSDELKRVRYDYNKLLVTVFRDNFIRVFQDFCTDNNVKCRYQAYGTPFLMGMTEGNMIPDIPEGNNWIYSSDMNAGEWNWNQPHGYMIWNLYAASGGHLTGRPVISCESMTNTRGVFQTSLEEIKQHDDMNFISGINHTVLHGFNYSPPEAGFPGWIRYGSYFSEQNTWWPYFSKWVDYNARLSCVLQRSQPVKNIAVLIPEGDLWSQKGLSRVPFHTGPWYCHRLWEPLSQAGSSCDYISEKIIQQGNKSKATLNYGPMSYQAVILCSIQSIEPGTALALKEFVKNGGRLIVLDDIPRRSLSMQNAAVNDRVVQNSFTEITQYYPDRIFQLNSPQSEGELLSWTMDLLKRINIKTDVTIEKPDKNVFQIRQVLEKKDIYFFTNSNRAKSVLLNTRFPTGKKTPWIWNPEDGTRKVFPFGESENELAIELSPLQSLLLIFDPDLNGEPDQSVKDRIGNKTIPLEGPWKVSFFHVNGSRFERNFEKLTDFGTSEDPQLNTFAGKVTYTTTFTSDGIGDWLELGRVNKGITEVCLNGKQLGTNWYGKPQFPLNDVLLNGENRLEIKYTTVLSNYARSLKDNPTAERWTQGFTNIPAGLEGNVNVIIKQ